MSLLNIIANILNPKAGDRIHDPIHGNENYDSGSFALDVDQALKAIDRIYKRSKIKMLTSVRDLGLSETTVTIDDLFQKNQPDSMIRFSVLSTSHPNLDTPVIAGAKQSGTLTVIGNTFAYDRCGLEFYNHNGVWRRYYSTEFSNSDPQQDSGWLWMSSQGSQVQITAAMVTSLGNKLSNLTMPGEYFISGTDMTSFTDSPYTFFSTSNLASYIEVKRMMRDRGVIQEVRSNTNSQASFSRQITSAGVVGAWRQRAVGDYNFTSSAAMNFAGGIFSGHLTPDAPATRNIGGTTNPVNNIYVQNAPVVVSDREHKTEIGGIPDQVLDAWALVNYSQFKMKAAVEEKGAAARYHVGVIAQEIRDTFESVGLDATQYGILCHEEWDAVEPVEFQPAVYDEATGELTSEEIPESLDVEAGEIWMVRMEECLALEAALMRRELSKIKSSLFS